MIVIGSVYHSHQPSQNRFNLSGGPAMANPEHLEISEAGGGGLESVEGEEPEVRPNLAEVKLIRANLSLANFSYADLA